MDCLLSQVAHQILSANMGKTKRTQTKPSPFVDAVDRCHELRGTAQPGLSALGSDSATVCADDTRLLDGSVNIDDVLKTLYPNAARWDYAVGFDGEVYFIEVHPAATKNIDEMIRKLTWLRQWLLEKAPELKALHRCEVYYWIPSGRVRILKTSSQYRRIAASKLKISPSPLHLKKR